MYFFWHEFNFLKITPSEWIVDFFFSCFANEILSIVFNKLHVQTKLLYIESQNNDEKKLSLNTLNVHSMYVYNVYILLNVHLGPVSFRTLRIRICVCLFACVYVTVHWIAVCFKIKTSIYFNSKIIYIHTDIIQGAHIQLQY